MSFAEARQCVLETVRGARPTPALEVVDLDASCGRVLAEDAAADRDLPPTARALRDGFALRAEDAPGEFRVLAEVRAGAAFAGEVGPLQAVEIMTGAPLPPGADAVVMVEHVRREGDRVRVPGPVARGQFVNPRGAEARAGDVLLTAGAALDYSGVAILASLGRSRVNVFAGPEVAILSTGDELIPVTRQPLDCQTRNSNAWSLAAQVRRAGGRPEILAVAPDEFDATYALVDRGLASGLLLISGGVSAGKYDLVERVLAGFGAEFYFDRVLIQPGQPLVFGRARGTFFFGLPGNPASTMVTFEVFARAAVELLGGVREPALHTPLARLAADFRHKPGLTRFLPARLSGDGVEVTPVPWRGSSDMPAVARANAWMVAEAGRASWARGDFIPVLLK